MCVHCTQFNPTYHVMAFLTRIPMSLVQTIAVSFVHTDDMAVVMPIVMMTGPMGW